MAKLLAMSALLACSAISVEIIVIDEYMAKTKEKQAMALQKNTVDDIFTYSSHY